MPDLSTETVPDVQNKTPLTARNHLATLDAEMAMLAGMRGELQTLLNFCRTGYGRELVRVRINFITRRLVRAQAEVFAVSGAYFAELQKAARDEKYPPIRAANKSVIRYADE